MKQILIASVDGSGVKQLMHLTGYMQNMQRSPDSKSIDVMQKRMHTASRVQPKPVRGKSASPSRIDEQQITIWTG